MSVASFLTASNLISWESKKELSRHHLLNLNIVLDIYKCYCEYISDKKSGDWTGNYVANIQSTYNLKPTNIVQNYE